jgi:cytochrome b561
MPIHALFGALLWGSVVTSFYRRVHRTPHMPAIELRASSRLLSRRVYLVLYVAMFFHLAIGSLGAPPHHPIPARAEDFQSYLAWGCVTLITIHVLAALYSASPVNWLQRNGRLT